MVVMVTVIMDYLSGSQPFCAMSAVAARWRQGKIRALLCCCPKALLEVGVARAHNLLSRWSLILDYYMHCY
jgi:hypothetical protein